MIIEDEFTESPDEIVAARIIDELLAKKFIRANRKDNITREIVSGSINEQYWKEEIDFALMDIQSKE